MPITKASSGDGGRVSFTAGQAEAGLRLDQALAARVPGLSRRRARLLLDIGGVFVDGRRVKVAGRLVRAGEQIVAHPGGALERATPKTGRAARTQDEARLPPHTIVFEAEEVVGVDKPAGRLTAPTPESDRNNLASLLARRPGGGPVHVVHRIDLETSGLLVFAKTEDANRALSERFRTHDLEREYLAVVAGAFPDGTRVIDRPVGGKRAVTHVAIEERLGARATLLRCRLETGRTHQIRLHAHAEGHPVLGDPRYGGPPMSPRPPRMALHATLLAFAQPRTGAPLSFTSPWPADLAAWLEALRRAG
ncbi:MAG TPA: RluA family pseudouridine synthase [Polyangia bacterium]|nr:RluA family pseudouridine synthase [Polyangia bacterium]